MHKGKAARGLKGMLKILPACCLLLALWAPYPVGGRLTAMAAELPSVGEGRQEGEAPETGREPEGEGGEEPVQAPEEGDVRQGEAPEGGGAAPQRVAPTTNAHTPLPDGASNGIASDFTPVEGEEAWEGTLRVLMSSRIRSTPDTVSSIVGSLTEDAIVSAVGRLNDENGELWYHIRSEEMAVEGYIKADLAEVIESEGGEEPSPAPLVKVKSNFAMDGANRMKMQEAVPVMAQAADGAPDVTAGRGGAGNFLTAIRSRIDLNVVILIVAAAWAFVLLCHIYGRVTASLLPKQDMPAASLLSKRDVPAARKKAKKGRRRGKKPSGQARG